MDFFEAQESARRNTSKLMILFVLAVLVILALTDLVLYYSLGLERALHSLESDNSSGASNWGILHFLWINLAVVLLILAGTAYKIFALSGGGDAVAQMLDGQPVFKDDPDPGRRQLLNIVEEMAIASGVPVPQVYVLPEQGINAFAAGFDQSDTIIGVTAGAIQYLNRDQLQGVVAHEFSHILSGDMRLNVRLAGVLHGIMLLGLIGRRLCHPVERNDYGRRKDSLSLSSVGIGLIAVGYVGYFCGRLIKAAICRQREYLADAAAVQFTRNPDGIGGALLQIGASNQGARLQHRKSEQLNHAFFCDSLRQGVFSQMLAAHPPLAARIRRILPDWNGAFPVLSKDAEPARVSDTVSFAAKARQTSYDNDALVAKLLGAAGTVSDAQIATARILNTSFPEVLSKASQDPFAARALIFFLVLDEAPAVREKQLEHLKSSADQGVYAEIRRLLKSGAHAKTGQKIPLVELALPRFRQLSANQARLFLDNLHVLIQADKRITLFEWCLAKVVRQYVADLVATYKPVRRRLHDLTEVAAEATVLFSAFAHLAAGAECRAEELFMTACAEAGLSGYALSSATNLGLRTIDQAVDTLAALTPLEKSRLLRGCIRCLCSANSMPHKQWELLRGVCAVLQVPMPLMPGE